MKRMGLLSITLAAAVTLACGGNGNDRAEFDANNAPGADTVGTTGDNQLTGGDRDFIEESAAAGMAEVELGKLALERGQSADVKRFAQMMVDEHSKSGEALQQVAGRYNFTPPATLADDHRELRDRLSRLQGAEFDREYMQAMVDGHEDVVDHLESRVDRNGAGAAYSNDAVGDDNAPARERGATGTAMPAPQQSDNAATSAVNQWAATTLPAAEKHLAEARTINERLEQGGRSSN